MDDAYFSQGSCPHVNRNDPRCGSRFTVDRLDQAFAVCFGSYQGCPMYHRINAELSGSPGQGAVVRIAVSGHARQFSLRPTGT